MIERIFLGPSCGSTIQEHSLYHLVKCGIFVVFQSSHHDDQTIAVDDLILLLLCGTQKRTGKNASSTNFRKLWYKIIHTLCTDLCSLYTAAESGSARVDKIKVTSFTLENIYCTIVKHLILYEAENNITLVNMFRNRYN